MYRSAPSPRRLALAVLFCHAATLVLNVGCVKLPRRAHADAGLESPPHAAQVQTGARTAKPAPPRAIDINRATREELATLPGIGDGLAARIVDHRARYGAFRRAEHLLIVRGISERRFARLRPYVSVE